MIRQKLEVFYNPQVYVKTEIKGITILKFMLRQKLKVLQSSSVCNDRN